MKPILMMDANQLVTEVNGAASEKQSMYGNHKDPLGALVAFGVSEVTITFLRESGVIMKLNTAGCKFHIPGHSEYLTAKVTQLDFLKAAQSTVPYKASSDVLDSLKQTIGKVVHILSQLGKSQPDSQPAKALKEALSGNKPNPSESPVGLKSAERLYQRVVGTTSCYYVIGMGDGINLAVRYQSNHTLSCRVEGAKMAAYTEQLTRLGFTVNGGYASAHTNVKDDQEAAQIMGAMLFGLYIDVTVMPKPAVLQLKGLA